MVFTKDEQRSHSLTVFWRIKLPILRLFPTAAIEILRFL
jgi:hypothetical protein